MVGTASSIWVSQLQCTHVNGNEDEDILHGEDAVGPASAPDS